jgi:hypothetical protein
MTPFPPSSAIIEVYNQKYSHGDVFSIPWLDTRNTEFLMQPHFIYSTHYNQTLDPLGALP